MAYLQFVAWQMVFLVSPEKFSIPEASSEPCQTSKIECFAKAANVKAKLYFYFLNYFLSQTVWQDFQ